MLRTGDDPRKAAHARYGMPKADSERLWERYYDRFDMEKEPNEPFRFGWVVEVDPYDPTMTPVKRTTLGRFTHEAAYTGVASDGRVVVYTGDVHRRRRAIRLRVQVRLGRAVQPERPRGEHESARLGHLVRGEVQR